MPHKAYRYRFYPTPEQVVNLSRTFGCVRDVYNRSLRHRQDAWVRAAREYLLSAKFGTVDRMEASAGTRLAERCVERPVATVVAPFTDGVPQLLPRPGEISDLQ